LHPVDVPQHVIQRDGIRRVLLDSLPETRDSAVMADFRGSLKKSKKPRPG